MIQKRHFSREGSPRDAAVRGSRDALALKRMPELRFRIDATFDEADRIDRLLRSPEVARDLKSKREDPQ